MTPIFVEKNPVNKEKQKQIVTKKRAKQDYKTKKTYIKKPYKR